MVKTLYSTQLWTITTCISEEVSIVYAHILALEKMKVPSLFQKLRNAELDPTNRKGQVNTLVLP